jgi:hypothetical protein
MINLALRIHLIFNHKGFMRTHIVWLCVSVVALLVGTQFAKKEIQIVEKPVEVVRTKEVIVEKPVEVIKEIPKEVERIVEKRVEVPAEIPDDYKLAKHFVDSFVQAKFDENAILRGVKDIQVVVSVSDESKITKSELKDLIELALRKNGVPVKDVSSNWLNIEINGVWDNSDTTYSYSATMLLRMAVPVLRPEGFKVAPVIAWSNAYVGYAGSQKVSEEISNAADKLVVSFSNAYLSANPK